MITHSLLHPFPGAPLAGVGERLIGDLMLDPALICICPDVPLRRRLIAQLTALPADAETILFRQDIMRCFLSHPDLLPAWRLLLDRLCTLRRETDEARRSHMSAQKSVAPELRFHSAKNAVQTAAVMLRRTLLCLDEMQALLSRFALDIPGLSTVTERLTQISRSPAHDELLELARTLSDLSAAGSYTFSLTLNDEGRVAQCAYLDAPLYQTFPHEPSRRRLFGGRREKESITTEESTVIDGRLPALRRQLVENALFACADRLEQISHSFFAEFCPLAQEITFYEAGIRLVDFYTERGLPTTLPVLLPLSGGLHARGLYDPYLAAALPASAIVANDIDLTQRRGTIVTGANNSGKTVWLRATGCLLLLGQAGLPVCAAEAAFAPVGGIDSVFAAAERTEAIGEEAGRFEEEVRLLAAVVERIESGQNNTAAETLLLLNEPFQTTAYREGAEGLTDILRYLEHYGVRWLLVTHLDALPRLTAGLFPLLLCCAESHRVSPCP